MSDFDDLLSVMKERDRLLIEVDNWRQNYLLLANTINPDEDQPALEAAKELLDKVDRYESALMAIGMVVHKNL